MSSKTWKWKLPSRFCVVLFDSTQSEDMSKVKHGETLFPFVRYLSSRNSAFTLKRVKRWLNTNVEKIYVKESQVQKQQECLVSDGKQKKAREINFKAISISELYVLNENRCVVSLLRLTNAKDISDVFQEKPLHSIDKDIFKKLKNAVLHICLLQKSLTMSVLQNEN